MIGSGKILSYFIERDWLWYQSLGNLDKEPIAQKMAEAMF